MPLWLGAKEQPRYEVGTIAESDEISQPMTLTFSAWGPF